MVNVISKRGAHGTCTRAPTVVVESSKAEVIFKQHAEDDIGNASRKRLTNGAQCRMANMIIIYFQHRPLSSAIGLPKTARACHAPPAQPPSRSPAKERAPPPASVSDDF
ncbi:unnamed protein product [Laminaria digitata]